MNKHLHIAVPDKGWVLEWFGRTLKEHLQDRCKVTMSDGSNPNADLNICMTWWARHPDRPEEIRLHKTKIDVGRFTHLNPVYAFNVREQFAFFDHIIALTTEGKEILIEYGVAPEDITIIGCGVDGFHPRALNVGISGRPYSNYRKRENLLLELFWIMKPEDFYLLHFMFLGPDWDNIVDRMSKAQAARVTYFKDVDYENYPKIFAHFDVYVNTAFVEGGPVGVAQAMACGIPVISPKHGYAKEYGALYFDDAEGLATRLESLIRKPRYTRTWGEWAEDHWALFERLWG